MKKIFLFAIALGVIILDQITKLLVIQRSQLGESIPIIHNFLFLTYIRNTGAGWGILQGQATALIWITIIVIGVILTMYDKITPGAESVFTGLILGGAIGNLIDRIRLGFVIDFIDFKFWPAFNVADSALTVGAVGFILYWFIFERKRLH